MNQNVPQVTNIQQYHQHFRRASQPLRVSPLVNRSCNQKLCYILFILITAAFLIIGIFFIHNTNMRSVVSSIFHKDYKFRQQYFIQDFRAENIRPALPIILAMMGLSLVLSVTFLCLLTIIPKVSLIFMIIVGIASIFGISGLLFYVNSLLPGIFGLLIAVSFTIVIGFSCKKIKIGLSILNFSSKFLKQRPSTFVAPFVIFIFICSFFLFWGMSFSGIILYRGQAKTQAQVADQHNSNTGVALLWIVFYVFYSLIFHYCLSFFIGTATSIWYFRQQQNYVPRSFGRILRNHLGSFTLASLIVGIVFLARKNFQRYSTSGILSCCLCCVNSCIKSMQNIQQTLNHNAILTMSVTGQSYFDSAKSTLSLIFQNFSLFFLVDLISHIITIAGVMFAGGLPAIIGFVLLQSTMENSNDNTILVIGVVTVCLFGMLVGGIFIGTFSESLTSTLIFFCLDRKFMQMGYPAHDHVPQGLRRLLNQLSPYVGGQYNEYYNQNSNINNSNAPRNSGRSINNELVDSYVRADLF